MRIPDTKLVAIFALLIGVTLSSPLLADPDTRPDTRENKRPMRQHDGDHPMGGRGHGGGYMRGARWLQSLSDEQQTKIEKLKLDFVKKKVALKARTKTLKTDLSLLVTKNNANMAEINRKIDQLVKLKKQILRLKYAHWVAVRKELTAEQRVSFDLMVMRKTRRDRYRHR